MFTGGIEMEHWLEIVITKIGNSDLQSNRWFCLYYLPRVRRCIYDGYSQWAFTCSNLTIETLEQGVKYAQS